MFSAMAQKLKKIASRNGITANTSYLQVEHHFNEFSILLPPDHLLPAYQQKYPKYDRFLPLLASYVQASEAIVDIGANVGDTLAGMAEKNDNPTYICIEADPVYFEYLKQNICRIKEVKKDLRVFSINKLVGKSVSGGSLEGEGGTRHVVLGKGGMMQSEQLDALVCGFPNIDCIRIIKSDIDGFDYDALNSSMRLIRQHKPMIYFECYYVDEDQKNGFDDLISSLGSEGYSDWVLFDNYGGMILRTDNTQIVHQMMNYLWSQQTGNNSRTLYYLDILAAHASDKQLIDDALASYK